MAESRAPDRSPLGRDFRKFWLAAASSNLGDGIRLAALPLLALSLTDDARLISVVSAASLLPWLVFGPLGGVLVDRVDRRRLMIGGQIARGAVAAALVGLMATDTVTIWWVAVVAFGLGLGEVVVDSSSQAAVPQLVEPHQLDRANGQLLAAITTLDQVVGVALGAALFGVASGLPFAIDASTFLVGAALLATIRRPLQGQRTSRGSARSDLAEGMRFLFGHRLLRGLMVAVATSNLAGNVAFGVFVVLAVEEIGASEEAFGLVLAIGAVGGIAGSLVAARLADRFGRRRLLAALPAALTITHLINATAGSVWILSVSFFIASFSVVCFNIPGQSLRQAITPEPLLGRVVATFRTFGMGAAPIGAILGGFIAEAAGVRAASVAAAGLETIAWVMMVMALRHLDDQPHEAPPPRSRNV